MNFAKQQAQVFRPPIISFSLAFIAAIGSIILYRYSLFGLPLAAPMAMAAGVYTSFQLIRGITDQSRVNAYKRSRQLLKSKASLHGKARFANEDELRNEGLINSGNKGIYLGNAHGKEIWFNQPLSMNLVGASGSGKTSVVFIITLLAAMARTADQIATARSWIINDPALQAYAVTHEALIDNGYEVGVLSSWTGEYTKKLEFPIDDVGLDPFATLNLEKDAEATVRDECKYRIEFLIPKEKPGFDEQSKYFRQGARTLLEIPALYELSIGKRPNLVSLHNYMMGSTESLNELFILCQETNAFDGYLANIAASMAGIMNGSPEQFAGYMGNVYDAINCFSPGSAIGSHVSGSTFDVAKLKSEKKPYALFVGYPGRFNHTHQQMKEAEFNYLFEMVCADPRKRHVTALLDESASIYLPSMLRYLNEGRKYGFSIVNGFQEIFGQTEKAYGKSGATQIFSAGAVNWFTHIRDKETCKIICDLAGVQGIEDLSINNQKTGSQDPFDHSFGSSNKGVPMFRDIRTELLADEALILCKNLLPILAKKVPYFKHPNWSAIAGRDPYES